MRGVERRALAPLLPLVLACLLACSCTGVQAADTDAAALLDFKAAVAGASNALDSWAAGTDPCSSWTGVNCTVDQVTSLSRVTSIVLPNAGLSGSLPDTADLSALRLLDLSNNQLAGTLPPTLQLRYLQRFLLPNNQLSGTLPASWAANFTQLQDLQLQGNRLASTMPAAWIEATGFGLPFSATVQPGNRLLCGDISPSDNHTLLFSDAGVKHEVLTTLGSCAQGDCGSASINGSATNLYDVAWANRIAPLDLEFKNPNVQQNSVPLQGTPVALPCYPSNRPTFFGADVAYRKATWQSSTAGSRTSDLPVLGTADAVNPLTSCSATLTAPGFWMVDLQVSTRVLAVSVLAGEQQMQGVVIRVGDTPDPSSGSICVSSASFDPGAGRLFACQNIAQGRFVSISASTRVSLCQVKVYPLVTNAALGKRTSTSSESGSSDSQADVVVDGVFSNTNKACSTTVSGPSLAAWITIDLGYEASLETVVVLNGDNTFKQDLYVRLGSKYVVNGDENDVCAGPVDIGQKNLAPIQCVGVGRYLTLYRKLDQASTMYICQVAAFLSAGPNGFIQRPPSPPAAPPPAPLAPPPIVPIEVTAATTAMDVALVLQGPQLLPVDAEVQQSIVQAASRLWLNQQGMTSVSALSYQELATVQQDGGSGAASASSPLPGAASPAPDASMGRMRMLLVSGSKRRLSDSASATSQVAVQLRVDVAAGMAPSAASYIVETVQNGALAAALKDEGLVGSTATASYVRDLNASPPSPAPSPPEPDSGSSVPIGAIVGGVVGGVVLLAAVLGLLFCARRRRRLAGRPVKDDDGSDSPKVLGSMEQGTSTPILGLPKPGEYGNGFSVAVAAAGQVPLQLKLDGEPMTSGPSPDIIKFLSLDAASDHSTMVFEPSSATAAAAAGGSSGAEALARTLARDSTDGVGQLQKQRSVASRMDSGVSELWTVDFKELDIQKQIGEGSFGKVYLAKWRETTVAVKVLGNMGTGTSPGLDDEFPDAASAKGHPLYESLQKEAAMMASLRHPSIVMYLGVCLDPPAVVTEYCARGSLNDVLKRARTSSLLAAQLDWPRRLNMALDAAKGMLYLHSCSPPIIHRDLKSANLLVDKHWRVRVCDFNLSRVMEDTAVLSSVAATNPRWLAPEILSGKGYTFASDVYSFGICMWELLTWQVPYHEYGPWQVVAMVTENAKRPEVPVHEDLPTGTFSGESEYLGLMHECWAQDPDARPTFAAIISRLRKMLALEASIRRSESPTKYGRTASGMLVSNGDETPLARSRLASLTTPDPRSGGEESDGDLLFSASPTVLGGGGAGTSAAAGAAGRPPRYSTGNGAPVRQLESIMGGGTDDSEAVAPAAAAGVADPVAAAAGVADPVAAAAMAAAIQQPSGSSPPAG